MEVEMFLRHESIRSEIYKLLAECYYPPDEALSGKIIDLIDKFGMICPRARQDIDWSEEEILNTVNIQELMVDHARLFLGPYALLAPPYGSVYLEAERRVMGNSTMDVANRYRGAGLTISERFKDVPDHIAVELEFMYYLVFKCIEAAKSNEADTVDENLKKQKEFLEDHLGSWISDFARTVSSQAETDFYRNLAIATRIFIGEDLTTLSSFDFSEIKAELSV